MRQSSLNNNYYSSLCLVRCRTYDIVENVSILVNIFVDSSGVQFHRRKGAREFCLSDCLCALRWLKKNLFSYRKSFDTFCLCLCVFSPPAVCFPPTIRVFTNRECAALWVCLCMRSLFERVHAGSLNLHNSSVCLSVNHTRRQNDVHGKLSDRIHHHPCVRRWLTLIFTTNRAPTSSRTRASATRRRRC